METSLGCLISPTTQKGLDNSLMKWREIEEKHIGHQRSYSSWWWSPHSLKCEYTLQIAVIKVTDRQTELIETLSGDLPAVVACMPVKLSRMAYYLKQTRGSCRPTKTTCCVTSAKSGITWLGQQCSLTANYEAYINKHKKVIHAFLIACNIKKRFYWLPVSIILLL